MKRLLTTALCLGLAACGGDSDGDGNGDGDLGGGFDAGADTAIPADLGDPGEPVAPSWALLLGAPNAGSYDQEGLLALHTDDDGGLVAFSDRRYNDDPYGPFLLRWTIAADGTVDAQESLRFDDDMDLREVLVDASGNLVVVLEGDPSVLVLDDAGAVTLARTFAREPYAFGGMSVLDAALGPDGDLYLVGTLNPSEDSGERGFLAKVGPDGAALWLRTWDHEAFAEQLRVAAGPAGIFVVDEVPGDNELNRRMVLLGFSADGSSLGQHALMRDSFDGLVAAANRVELLATDDGVEVIGTRSTATDERFAMFVYRITFDGDLALQDVAGTQVPAEAAVFARSLQLTEHPSGALSVTANLGDRYALIHFEAGSDVARVYDVVRSDGTSPATDDEDYPLLAAPGPDDTLYLGGTGETLGTLELRPYHALAADLPLTLLDPELTVYTDTFVGSDATFSVTPQDDTASVVDDPAADDRDVFLLRTAL